jgi:hypothetical protein
VSELAQNVDENLVLENDTKSELRTDDEKSQSTINQNGEA